jgi:hypothetical protein
MSIPEKQGGRNPPYKLVEEILERSVAPTWPEARREWKLKDIYTADEPGACLCGKYPIIEICIIVNRKNGNVAMVGNECVKRFMGMPSERLFANLRRIARNLDAAPSKALLDHAIERGWLDEWQKEFSLKTYCNRRLTPRQRTKRREINSVILRRASASKEGDANA